MDGEDGGETSGECVIEEFSVAHLLFVVFRHKDKNRKVRKLREWNFVRL